MLLDPGLGDPHNAPTQKVIPKNQVAEVSKVDSGQVELTKKASLSLAKEDTPLKSASLLSLRDMARQDPEILEFFRIVHEHDLREKALELIESKLSRRN